MVHCTLPEMINQIRKLGTPPFVAFFLSYLKEDHVEDTPTTLHCLKNVYYPAGATDSILNNM